MFLIPNDNETLDYCIYVNKNDLNFGVLLFCILLSFLITISCIYALDELEFKQTKKRTSGFIDIEIGTEIKTEKKH